MQKKGRRVEGKCVKKKKKKKKIRQNKSTSLGDNYLPELSDLETENKRDKH